MALLDALEISEIMENNHIRGAYVSEQNCYGIEDSHQIGIILFYEPKEVRTADSETGQTCDTRHGNTPHDFCPN